MQQTSVVLVVSHAVLCEGLAARLSEQVDITVVGSTNSLEHLESLVQEEGPQVVVVDFDLARLDSSQILTDIYRRTFAPAVVLLAGECEPEVAMRALRSGAAAVVLRDCPLQDLAAAIRRAHRKEMWLAPTLLSGLMGNMERDGSGVDVRHRLSQLSARELEVLRLLVEGVGLPEMAEQLNIALNTVRSHTRNIHLKLQVHSNVAAVSLALEKEMIR